MEATVNHKYDDLRSLYRAAAREEQPTRTDLRAVRTAILGAGVTAATLHASTATAAGKLIALIPGGAKVLTIGQVVAYAGLGVALGGGLAAVGVAVTPKTTVTANSASASRSVRQASARSNSRTGRPAANAEEASEPLQPADVEPATDPKSAPDNPANLERPLLSDTTVADRPAPSQRNAAPILPALTAVTRPATPAAVNPPSLGEESRGLAAVQTALGARDAQRALALLDAQDRDYRAGSLGQERSAARVLALCMAGRKVEAIVARDRFISSYPGSPLIRRISATCRK
jgi:hypothetical protein